MSVSLWGKQGCKVFPIMEEEMLVVHIQWLAKTKSGTKITQQVKLDWDDWIMLGPLKKVINVSV